MCFHRNVRVTPPHEFATVVEVGVDAIERVGVRVADGTRPSWGPFKCTCTMSTCLVFKKEKKKKKKKKEIKKDKKEKKE